MPELSVNLPVRAPDTLDRLIGRLPAPLARAIRWLNRPGRAWLRLPAALALILGGLLGFLPVLGFWMLPLGVLLLVEDFPALRAPTNRALDGLHGVWQRRGRGLRKRLRWPR